jgi:hypothetical protein
MWRNADALSRMKNNEQTYLNETQKDIKLLQYGFNGI